MCACASWKAICMAPSGESLAAFSAAELKCSTRSIAWSVRARVASKARCASAMLVLMSLGSLKARAVGGARGVCGVDTLGIAVLAAWISLQKRSTATPSPHACSKLIAAFPFAVTMSVNDLSYQRPPPFPWRNVELTSRGSVGDASSSARTKRAESIDSSDAAFVGSLECRRSRSPAHVRRSSVVSSPTSSEATGTGVLSAASMMAWSPAWTSGRGMVAPSSSSTSRLQKVPPRSTAMCLVPGLTWRRSISGPGRRVERKRLAYWLMSSGYAPQAAAP